MARLALAACLGALAGCYDFSVFQQPDPVDAGHGHDLAAGGDLAGADLGSGDLGPTTSGWAPLDNPAFDRLLGVWGTAANNVYAVGDSGTVIHWDGTHWTAQPVPPSEAATILEGVGGSSANDLWIVGDTGTILRSTGDGKWSSAPSPVSTELTSLWVAPTGDGWATGYNGTLLRLQGAQWKDVSIQGITDDLISVSGTTTDVYAVGKSALVLHRSIAQMVWMKEMIDDQSDLFGVWSGGLSAVAVGADGKIVDTATGGTLWNVPDSPVKGQFVGLFGVWGGSAGDVYAVGDNGLILHFDGQTWQKQDSGTMAQLRAVWGSGGEVFAVGVGGVVLHRSK
jgi:hypothetical protein